MRPTASTMLQQNNNNNYPCMNMSGSTREILQRCSKSYLPLPSRLELGIGDLPLIRGLRAWALCSKSRRRGGGLLGGGQAPTAPPPGRRGSTPCRRPADVHLSEEWGRMGYGLPLGLDAGRAGIGALVTVATLKTSEGSGKTQTQCLFLRTERGSCLYSTAKPDPGVLSSTGSGGWLRGKAGGGGRDTPGGRRDHGLTPPAQTGANRVRVRSGRRWRKSCNAAGWEKTGVSGERLQGSREDGAGEIIPEERKEELDKGGLEDKQFLIQDVRRTGREKEGASPRRCHDASLRTCIQCDIRARRRESHEGGESPRGGVPNRLNVEVKGMRRERRRNEEEEDEEEGGLCLLESSDYVLAAPNPHLEYNHAEPGSHSGRGVEEIRGAENEEAKTQASHNTDACLEREEDTDGRLVEPHANNDSIHGQTEQVMDDFATRHSGDFDDRTPSEAPREETASNAEGSSVRATARQESEADMEGVDVGEGSIDRTAKVSRVSTRCEDISVSTCPVSTSAAVFLLHPLAAEGSTCSADGEARGAPRERASSKESHREGHPPGVTDRGVTGNAEQQELSCVSDESNTVNENSKPPFFFTNVWGEDASPTPLISDADGRITTESNYSATEPNGAERRDEPLRENRADESQAENIERRVNHEAREIWVRGCAHIELQGDGDVKGEEDDMIDSSARGEDDKDVTRTCALKGNCGGALDGCSGWREEVGDTCGRSSISRVGANGETCANFTHSARADPPTSPGLFPANPAPSLPPLGAMATGLPCLEVEKKEEEEEEEEEEEGVSVTTGGRGGRTRHGRELEEQGEEERSSTVATEEKRTEEEEEKETRTEEEEEEETRTEEEEEEGEDEFGVFMQAEGEPAGSEGSTMSASVPCGSRASVAHGNHAISRESIHWTPGWTDSSFHQPGDTWTAFPQDSTDHRGDVVGQWWPTSAVEEDGDRLLTSPNLAAVFADAFPSRPPLSPSDPCDFDTVPTLTQLLRGKASQDQGLLDGFHDLNKMICQRYMRANGVSHDLLLRTLHLKQPHSENRPASRAASRLSPGLPSANHHAQNAAAKRRLSYDHNRTITE